MQLKIKKIYMILLICILILSSYSCFCLFETKSKLAINKGNSIKYKWNIALANTNDSITYILAAKFKEELEKKSAGSIQVNIYSNGVVGGDQEAIIDCQMGNLTFVVQSTAPQVSFIPEVAIFDMPNIFSNIKIARRVVDGAFFSKIKPYYEKKRLIILGYADQHFRELTTNKLLNNITDLKGIKIRTMQDPYQIQYWKTLGANPTPMAYSELYVGLQQKTIDAQENSFETMVASKIYEQQKYVWDTDHIVDWVSIIMNKRIYYQLPLKICNIVNEAARETIKYARNMSDRRLQQKKKLMEGSGCIFMHIPAKMKAEMIERSKYTNKMICENIGNDLVDVLLGEIDKFN